MRLIDADVLLAKLREIGNEPDYQHNGEDWGLAFVSQKQRLKTPSPLTLFL